MRVNYPEINFFLWAVLNDRVEIAIVLLSLIKVYFIKFVEIF
jgi:hypothetical protein